MKKPSKAKASKKVPAPIIVKDEARYLSKEHLLRCELAQAKVESAANAVSAHEMRINEFRREYEARAHSAQLQLQTLRANLEAQVKSTEALWAEMGSIYGLDFRSVSYDDETGKINILQKE